MSEDIKQIIANNIKYLRTKKNISALELSELVGVSQSSVSDWENAKKMPRAGSIEKLAQVFNVDKTDILTERSSNRKDTKVVESDLAKMVDNAMSFNGQPVTDHDREIIMAYLKGRFGENEG